MKGQRKYPAFGYQVDVTRLSKLEESEFCCQGSAKLSAGSKTGPNSDVAEAKNGLGVNVGDRCAPVCCHGFHEGIKNGKNKLIQKYRWQAGRKCRK